MKCWKQPQVKAFGKWVHKMIDSSPSCESNRQNVTGAACVPVGKKVAGSEGGGCQRAQQGDAASLEMNASFDLFLFFNPLSRE